MCIRDRLPHRVIFRSESLSVIHQQQNPVSIANFRPGAAHSFLLDDIKAVTQASGCLLYTSRCV